MKKLLPLVLLTFCLLVTTAFAQDDDEPTVDVSAISVGTGTIPDYLTQRAGAGPNCEARINDDEMVGVEGDATDEQFVCLLEAVQAAGLAEALAGDGPFTVFAPTDRAFLNLASDMNVETTAELFADTEMLASILQYHVIPEGRSLQDIFISTEAMAGQMYSSTTLQGDTLMVGFPTGAGEGEDDMMLNVMVGDETMATDEGVTPQAYVSGTTIQVDNGFIIPIDTVMMPAMMEGEMMETGGIMEETGGMESGEMMEETGGEMEPMEPEDMEETGGDS